MSSICPKCKFLLTCDVLYKDSIIECEDFEKNQSKERMDKRLERMHEIERRIGCVKEKEKLVTNADRIRAMSDEELAVWIAETSNCSDWCILNEQCKTKQDYECCIDVWFKWLKEEAKGESDE